MPTLSCSGCRWPKPRDWLPKWIGGSRADFDNKTSEPVFDDTLKTALGVSLNQSPFLNVLSDKVKKKAAFRWRLSCLVCNSFFSWF
jgi:hypothetical protein